MSWGSIGLVEWDVQKLCWLLFVLIKGFLSVDCYIYICMGFYYHELRVHVQNPFGNPFDNPFSLGAFVLLIARKWDDAPMMHPAVEAPA